MIKGLVALVLLASALRGAVNFIPLIADYGVGVAGTWAAVLGTLEIACVVMLSTYFIYSAVQTIQEVHGGGHVAFLIGAEQEVDHGDDFFGAYSSPSNGLWTRVCDFMPPQACSEGAIRVGWFFGEDFLVLN